MRDVVIVSACRTAIGAFGGALKGIKSPHLASHVMRAAIARAKIDPSLLGDVRFGNCIEDHDALNPTRIAALLAGIPNTVPAVTINRVCTSGMEAVVSGTHQIQAGFSDIVLAGGFESMSNAPYIIPSARWGARLMDQEMVDSIMRALHVGSHYIPYPKDGPMEKARGKPYIMGLTAEMLAQKYNITREEMDEVALRSHNAAEAATVSGKFAEEIVPVDIGKGAIFDKDEHFKPGLKMEGLKMLKPAFIPTGTVTAGNSSGINDGASALVIMSLEKAKKLGVKPLAKISGIGMGGNTPEEMGTSPCAAVADLLRRTGSSLSDYGRIEVNEAFAAQYIACEKLIKLNRSITNVNGSGIGLGHPVGSTGSRILVTLLHEMRRENIQKGMATLCGGGGISIATELTLM